MDPDPNEGKTSPDTGPTFRPEMTFEEITKALIRQRGAFTKRLMEKNEAPFR